MKEKDRDNFFYLFYKRSMDVDDYDIDNQEICKKLFKDVVF